MNPLCIDLFCGLGGWAEGFLSEGWDVIGFDIERHDYGNGSYPAQLVLQDVLTLRGSQFRNASCIVASPPCQAYSYRAMPWKRAKELPAPDNTLFHACFRIQDEACKAEGRYIPLVVENVKGCQKWVGTAKWHHGSYYLWGDVPAIMPILLGFRARTDAEKNSIAASIISTPLNVTAHQSTTGTKTHIPLEGHHNGVKQTGLVGKEWFDKGAAAFGSNSPARKAASAAIAKIPFELSSYIARVYKP
jgi:hypothetical protein